MERTILTIEQVAVTCGVSVQTINNWYKFKRENPNNEYAKLLPEYMTIGGHGQRFWDKSDIVALCAFKQKMPKGCKGVMGAVTQRYVKKV
jgi:predicted DNA-binding transcriptional regulator AlpA